jgi:hypothetical protein
LTKEPLTGGDPEDTHDWRFWQWTDQMPYDSASRLMAAQADSQPPFWWIGLFASEGGLLIVAVVLLIVTLLLGAFVISRRRP